MSLEVTIVRADAADVRALRSLLVVATVDLYRVAASPVDLVKYLDVSASELVIADRVNDSSTYVAVALDDRGYVIGTGYANDVGYIGGIVTVSKRRGVGQAILDHLIAQYPTAKHWMSVWSENTAMLSLAHTRGFEAATDDPDERYLSDLRFFILNRTDRADAVLLWPPIKELCAAA